MRQGPHSSCRSMRDNFVIPISVSLRCSKMALAAVISENGQNFLAKLLIWSNLLENFFDLAESIKLQPFKWKPQRNSVNEPKWLSNDFVQLMVSTLKAYFRYHLFACECHENGSVEKGNMSVVHLFILRLFKSEWSMKQSKINHA